jgi:hypothetical protein
VWGVPDPGLTETRVVGPRPAAAADAATTATARGAVISAPRIVRPRTTSPAIIAHQEPNGSRQMPRPWVAA